MKVRGRTRVRAVYRMHARVHQRRTGGRRQRIARRGHHRRCRCHCQRRRNDALDGMRMSCGLSVGLRLLLLLLLLLAAPVANATQSRRRGRHLHAMPPRTSLYGRRRRLLFFSLEDSLFSWQTDLLSFFFPFFFFAQFRLAVGRSFFGLLMPALLRLLLPFFVVVVWRGESISDSDTLGWRVRLSSPLFSLPFVSPPCGAPSGTLPLFVATLAEQRDRCRRCGRGALLPSRFIANSRRPRPRPASLPASLVCAKKGGRRVPFLPPLA